MAQYNELKAAISAVIRTNYNEEITGQILQDALIGMINVLGDGYLFMGVAIPATIPGTPDANVAYLAATNGSYPNFNDIVVGNEIAVLKWNGSWQKQTLANAFTDAERTKLAGIEAGAQVNTPVDGALDPDSVHPVENAVITAALENKANKIGDYPGMIVGTAQGLRGRTIAEMFTRRIVANGKSGNGAALVEKLRGRTLKWNQLVRNGNFNSGTDYFQGAGFYGGSLSVSDNILTITPGSGTPTQCDLRHNLANGLTVGHKYLLRFKIKASSGAIANISARMASVTNQNLTLSATFASSTYATISSVFESLYANAQILFFFTNITSGSTVQVDNVTLFDLTDIFGSGYEISTAEEFAALFDETYYAYNPGTLLPLKATGLLVKDTSDVEISTLSLPITTKAAKLNGVGESVVPFADGVNGIGALTDAADKVGCVKKFGFIDFKDLDWYNHSSGVFYANVTNLKQSATVAMLCSNYNLVSAKYNSQWSNLGNMQICKSADTGAANTRIVVKNTDYTTDRYAFRTGNAGVKLIFELTTPQEYVWDEPLEMIYPVDKDGTETVLPIGVDANDVPNTAPLDADIVYPVRNVVTYIENEAVTNPGPGTIRYYTDESGEHIAVYTIARGWVEIWSES